MTALATSDRALSEWGSGIARYSVVAFFLLFGLAKFTEAEAVSIQPMVAASPFLGWLYLALDVRQASNVIGVVEIATALLIAVRPWAPRLCAVGSGLAALTLLVTLSFLITTPNIDEAAFGFIVKDLTLLGVAIWSTGEALGAWQARREA